MTRRDRIQWIVLSALVLVLLVIVVWNLLLPGDGPDGRIPVIDEVLRRQQ